MKLVKMSLAAAMLMGVSAYAVENVKVDGSAKVFYDTASSTMEDPAGDIETDMFDRGGSNAQAALDLGVTADLTDGVSAGVRMTVTDTLGLEQNLVSGTWAGPVGWAGLTHEDVAAVPADVTTQYWFSEAWIAATIGKTTGKVGRMPLDTPLAFTETWNIAQNTFTAAVLINQDLPDTTLVGAYVGQGNGAASGTVGDASFNTSPFQAYTAYNNMGNVLEALGEISDAEAGFGGHGAYAAGIINNSFKPLTVQAWYYDVINVAQAYWLQADLNMNGILAGAQYASMMMDERTFVVGDGIYTDLTDAEDSTAFAVMLGYSFGDVATVKAAFSQTDEEGLLNIQNTATGTQSKLYTEAWWNYGIVGLPGTTAWMIAADGEVKDVVGWFAQYNSYEVDADYTYLGIGDPEKDTVQELALGVNKSFGPLDTSLAYIHAEADFDNGLAQVMTGATGDYTEDRLQVYLTLNF
jgi:hypothetical protein